MRTIVSFSGGKDSQACLIKACKDFGAANVTAVFCDTGWEHNKYLPRIVRMRKSLHPDT